MSKPTTAQKIGGEYGGVRMAIDVERLNVYLETHVPEVAAPVTVKQFKVCIQGLPPSRPLPHSCTGYSLDRYAFAIHFRSFLTSIRSVKSDLLSDGCKARRFPRPSARRFFY